MTRHITLSLGAAPVLALLLAGCATSGEMADRGPIEKGGTVPTEAQAAVLKTFFNNNASAIQNGAAAFCVASIDAAGRHYSDANLLSALSDNPKVKPASACSAPNTGAPVIETATGKSALLFNVSPLRCDSPGDCLVSVSYYEANLSAQQNLYRAKKSGGRWTVTLEQPGPVS